ncbi:hypothetical protein HK097_006664, partial [Rhizophlyctis rosea]
MKPSIEESTYVRHLREKVRRLEQEVEMVRTDGENRVRMLHQEFASLREQYEKRILDVTTTATQREIAAATQAREAAALRIAALEKQLSDLLTAYSDRIRIDPPTAGRDTTKDLQEAEIVALREREASLRRRILELEGLVETQTKRMDALRREREDLESTSRVKLEERDQIISSYDSKIAKLQHEVLNKVFAAEEQRALEEAAKWKLEVDRLRREMADLKGKLEISEGTRKAVHENTIAILGRAQEEGAKMVLMHHERALEALRREIMEERNRGE